MKKIPSKKPKLINLTPTGFLLLTLTILMTIGFNPSCFTKKSNLRLTIHLERKLLAKSSLLVFNFQEPYHAKQLGAYIAERFHLKLLESKKFKVVSLNNNSPWTRLGNNQEERLLEALAEAQDKKYDYILLGEVKNFYDGKINQSKISVQTRIIEVKTRITIFLAENSKISHSKDPSYPMMTSLSKFSHSPQLLADRLIEELIQKI